MEIYERIRLLRKEHLKLSQEKFGEILGVNRSNINNIEGNRLVKPEQKEPLYKLICKEFNVRYEWLMTGEGDMFNESQEDFFDKLAEQYGLGVFARKILEFYGSLEDEQKRTLEKFIYQAAMCVLEDNIAQAQAGIAEAVANANLPDLSSTAAIVFHEAFPYVGIGNITDEEFAQMTGEKTGAVDKAMAIYRVARSQDNAEHEIIKDGKGTIDKLSQIPPVTNKEDF
ncbi:MAG: helix-turn-helix domain-containing protein [Oscillospiraceae bacterium]